MEKMFCLMNLSSSTVLNYGEKSKNIWNAGNNLLKRMLKGQV